MRSMEDRTDYDDIFRKFYPNCEQMSKQWEIFINFDFEIVQFLTKNEIVRYL